MSDLVPVAVYPNRQQAELARASLSEAGIDATVSADDAGGMIPLTNGVAVLVLQEHLEQARAELTQREGKPPLVD